MKNLQVWAMVSGLALTASIAAFAGRKPAAMPPGDVERLAAYRKCSGVFGKSSDPAASPNSIESLTPQLLASLSAEKQVLDTDNALSIEEIMQNKDRVLADYKQSERVRESCADAAASLADGGHDSYGDTMVSARALQGTLSSPESPVLAPAHEAVAIPE
jgi:hypothetical protein